MSVSAISTPNILLVAVLAVMCNACSITNGDVYTTEEQKMSLTRWHQCIQRHRDAHRGSILALQRDVAIGCEGYQRDVVATYPEHLENQVDSLLSDHANEMNTEHFLRSSNLATWIPKKGADNDNLGIRMIGTLPEDL